MRKIILGVLSGLLVVILFQTIHIKNNRIMYVERMETADNDFNPTAFDEEKINYPEAYSCRRSFLPEKDGISSSITAGAGISEIGIRTFQLNKSKNYQILCIFTLIKTKKRLHGISTANSVDISTTQSMDNENIDKKPRCEKIGHY
jgi:hypothetical protein